MNDSARNEFVAWVRHACSPIAPSDASPGLDPAAGDAGLEALRDVVGNASIVGLGESWHSTAELLTLKNRMVRFLIDHAGFNAIAFEGGVPGSQHVDRYVAGGPGTAAAALRAFGQPMWLNPQTAALIDWLRKRNAGRSADETVRVFGIDPAYPGAAIGSVLAFLDRVDSGYRNPHRGMLEAVERAMLAVPLDSSAKSAVWGSTGVYESLSPEDQQRFRHACTELVARLETHRAAWSHAGSAAEFEWALRQAAVLMQAYDIVSVRSRSLGEANYARDLAFAENLVWFRQHMRPELRVIVIAHNMHVAREPFRSAADGPDIASMGGHLAAWLGDAYVAIGSAVGRGRHAGGADAGLAGVSPEAPDAKQAAAAQSNDAALEEAGLAQFLLPLRAAPQWASTPRLTRSHLEPQPHYRLARSFDAIAYVDRISRSAPLPL